MDGNGKVQRVRRKATIGTLKDLPTEKLARRAADQIITRAGINSLDYLPGKVATLDEFAVLWARDILPLQKPSSQAVERSHLKKHLLPALGQLKLEVIQPQLAQSFVRQLSSEGLSTKSIRNILMTLSSMLKTAKEWGYMVGSMGSKIKLPARKIRPRGRCYTQEEARAIIEGAPFPYDVMMVTAALTGLRCGELLGLRWLDVDFAMSVIHVQQSVWRGEVQTTKSEESDRTVPMPHQLAMALNDYRERWTPNDGGLLWAGETGEPIDADNLRHRMLRPLLDQVGVMGRAGFHAFRHLHGTLLVSTGANPKVAQAQLGHSDIRTTMDLYVDVISEDHRQAASKVADILAPVGANKRPALRLVK